MTFDEVARVEGERGGVAGRYVVARKELQAGQQVLYGSQYCTYVNLGRDSNRFQIENMTFGS